MGTSKDARDSMGKDMKGPKASNIKDPAEGDTVDSIEKRMHEPMNTGMDNSSDMS